MSSYVDNKLSKKIKFIYLFSVLGAFLAGLLVMIAIFPEDAVIVAIEYIFLLSCIILMLAIVYVLQKILFHLNATSEKDELHFEELPYDEDDIKNSH